MESQQKLIKALQYTYITKIPRRHTKEHAKKKTKHFDDRDTKQHGEILESDG
jgi:hypothetical protein